MRHITRTFNPLTSACKSRPGIKRPDMSDDKTSLSDEEVNLQFREIADAFIDLANDQSNHFNRENVSLALLYAAARFNAFIVAGHADDATAYDRDRNSAFDYFTGEYRRMLEENLDQYREMFGQLKYQHLMPDPPTDTPVEFEGHNPFVLKKYRRRALRPFQGPVPHRAPTRYRRIHQ